MFRVYRQRDMNKKTDMKKTTREHGILNLSSMFHTMPLEAINSPHLYIHEDDATK